LEETENLLTVEGGFAEWGSKATPQANAFENAIFALYDSSSNEVMISKIEGGHFRIEKVPSLGRYYGFLIGPDYQVRGSIQKKAATGDNTYYIFKFASTAGQLGTLILKDDKIESSAQSDLEFQTSLGVVQSPYKGDYSANFVQNPDIDGDGIPNMLDENVDDDDYKNNVDDKTYSQNSIEDSKIPWQHNYAYGIPKFGYFKCDHLKKPQSKIEFWCQLKVPPNFADKISLVSANIEAEMTDNGSNATSGMDTIANDGLWNARFELDTSQKPFYPRQLILANVTLKDGSKKSYFTTLGPEFPFQVSFKDDPTTQTPMTLTKTQLGGDLRVTQWFKTKQPPKGFVVELIMLDSSDLSFVKSFTKPLGRGDPEAEGSLDAAFPKFFVEDIEELALKKDSYKFKARIIGPAALPGLVGSGAETEITNSIPFPTPTVSP
jgi:hypothetical protein